MRNRPLWRWWLFCVALHVYSRARPDSWLERIAVEALGWATLPTWLGDVPVPSCSDVEVPF